MNNSHWSVKKTDHSVWKWHKKHSHEDNFWNDIITFIPYILYWIQAEWKFYIQTYCQIIWVKFTNMVAIIPRGHPHLANHTLLLSASVHFCLIPIPPNVRTSFMDGPCHEFYLCVMKCLTNCIIKTNGLTNQILILHDESYSCVRKRYQK